MLVISLDGENSVHLHHCAYHRREHNPNFHSVVYATSNKTLRRFNKIYPVK